MANKKNTSSEENQNIEQSTTVESYESETEKKVEAVQEEKTVSNVQEPVVMNSKTSNAVKQKSFFEKNRALIIIGGVALVGIFLLIAIIVIALFVFGGSKNVEQPMVYVTDEGSLKYITSNKKEASVISESIEGTINVEYSNLSNRYILYTKNNNLYLLDTKKNGESDKIASDVKSFLFSEDDKYIVFTNDEGNLYSYNFKDKEKLDSEITSIRAVTKDKVLYKKDGNLYMINIKSSKDGKEKIASDVYSSIVNEDNTKILYSKSNDDGTYDYYVYTMQNKKEQKVLSDVYTVYSYNDDFSKIIYGEKNTPEKYDLSKIVEDDKKKEDEAFKEYSYDQYLSGEIDYDTWRKGLTEKYNVQDRNKIREQLKDKIDLDATISVYYVSGKKKVLITDNAAKVLYTDADTSRVVYTTVTYDTSKKIKLSEVNYLYKIKNYLKECQRSDLMFKVGDKEASTVVEKLEKTVNVYAIKDDFYYLSDGELFYAKIKGNKLGKISSLSENVKVIDSTGTYKDSLLFATDVKDYVGDLKVTKNGKVDSIASDVYTSGTYTTETGRVYYFTDYKKQSGDLYMYNGKTNKVLTDVADARYVNDNYLYIVKDYSSKSGTYDLYRLKGSKLELVDYAVKKFY